MQAKIEFVEREQRGFPMARKRKGRSISGWVVLDKPVDIGSTECVYKIKWLYQAAKAGHAGTLDPLASGMLPIALGEATKTVPYIMEALKVYRFTVTWGMETATDDLEGETVAASSNRPSRETIESTIGKYVGDIKQIPPAFSAVKIGGQRAYDLARSGETVEIKAREVYINRFDLIDIPDADHAVFEVECGKGTYARSLARGLGRDLDCLGHISELRRLAIGPFDEPNMVLLDDLKGLEGNLGSLDGRLLATGVALHDFVMVPLNDGQASRVRLGNPVPLRGADAITHAEEACAVHGKDLVATGHIDKGSFHPKRVFKHSHI